MLLISQRAIITAVISIFTYFSMSRAQDIVSIVEIITSNKCENCGEYCPFPIFYHHGVSDTDNNADIVHTICIQCIEKSLEENRIFEMKCRSCDKFVSFCNFVRFIKLVAFTSNRIRDPNLPTIDNIQMISLDGFIAYENTAIRVLNELISYFDIYVVIFMLDLNNENEITLIKSFLEIYKPVDEIDPYNTLISCLANVSSASSESTGFSKQEILNRMIRADNRTNALSDRNGDMSDSSVDRSYEATGSSVDRSYDATGSSVDRSYETDDPANIGRKRRLTENGLSQCKRNRSEDTIPDLQRLKISTRKGKYTCLNYENKENYGLYELYDNSLYFNTPNFSETHSKNYFEFYVKIFSVKKLSKNIFISFLRAMILSAIGQKGMSVESVVDVIFPYVIISSKNNTRVTESKKGPKTLMKHQTGEELMNRHIEEYENTNKREYNEKMLKATFRHGIKIKYKKKTKIICNYLLINDNYQCLLDIIKDNLMYINDCADDEDINNANDMRNHVKEQTAQILDFLVAIVKNKTVEINFSYAEILELHRISRNFKFLSKKIEVLKVAIFNSDHTLIKLNSRKKIKINTAICTEIDRLANEFDLNGIRELISLYNRNMDCTIKAGLIIKLCNLQNNSLRIHSMIAVIKENLITSDIKELMSLKKNKNVLCSYLTALSVYLSQLFIKEIKSIISNNIMDVSNISMMNVGGARISIALFKTIQEFSSMYQKAMLSPALGTAEDVFYLYLFTNAYNKYVKNAQLNLENYEISLPVLNCAHYTLIYKFFISEMVRTPFIEHFNLLDDAMAYMLQTFDFYGVPMKISSEESNVLFRRFLGSNFTYSHISRDYIKNVKEFDYNQLFAYFEYFYFQKKIEAHNNWFGPGRRFSYTHLDNNAMNTPGSEVIDVVTIDTDSTHNDEGAANRVQVSEPDVITEPVTIEMIISLLKLKYYRTEEFYRISTIRDFALVLKEIIQAIIGCDKTRCFSYLECPDLLNCELHCNIANIMPLVELIIDRVFEVCHENRGGSADFLSIFLDLMSYY